MSHDRTSPSGEGGAEEEPRALELSAPAADEAALTAALEAGADAVYFRVEALNRRQRTARFPHARLPVVVQAAHAQGAQAFLLFDVDLAERELEIAARVLELARSAGCDAVQVRDPALLALHAAYPELDVHFSAQACITNSADVAAAGAQRVARAVLAAEMELDEIAAASAQGDAATEVVAAEVRPAEDGGCGIAGRSLLSSWTSGRSENRGYAGEGGRAATPPIESEGAAASAHEGSLADRLERLRHAGVRSLRIGGNLTDAAWVGRAVDFYRRALQGEDVTALADEIARRGSGRTPAASEDADDQQAPEETAARAFSVEQVWEEQGREEGRETETSAGAAPDQTTYDLELFIAPRGIEIRCQCAGIEEAWTIPKTVIHRPRKAISVEMLFQRLSSEPVHGCELRQMSTNDTEFLLVPRAVNALVSRISKIVQRGQRNRSELVTVKLAQPVAEILRKPVRHPGSQTPLGGDPDRVRLEWEAVEDFLSRVRPGSVVVEGVPAGKVRMVRALCRRIPLVVALPFVFFESQMDEIRGLLGDCARANVIVEVNSWGGWHLAKQAGVRMESGPGLPVLNSLAARTLAKAGIEAVTLSWEGDRRQFEEATAFCPLPTSLYVFGRPPLMISRTRPSEREIASAGGDRLATGLMNRRENGLWVLRSDEPFDLRNLENDRLRVKHLVVDLVGSPDPVGEWQFIPPHGKPAYRFNYERGLA